MSFVCTGRGTYPGACFGSVFQEQALSCVPAFIQIYCDCGLLIVFSSLLFAMCLIIMMFIRSDKVTDAREISIDNMR